MGDTRAGIMVRVMAWLQHCRCDPVRSVVTLAVTSARQVDRHVTLPRSRLAPTLAPALTRHQVAPELLLDLHLAAPLDAVEAVATGTAEAGAAAASATPSATPETAPAADATGVLDMAQQTWARAPPRPQLRQHSTHLRRDAFSSVAYESTARLRLAAFEQLRLSDDWAGVVRAKGFVSFVECPGYRLTLQACGARLEAIALRVAPSATSTSCLVLLGQGLQAPKLLRLLRECEVCARDRRDTHGTRMGHAWDTHGTRMGYA